jgi:hypothetical protein
MRLSWLGVLGAVIWGTGLAWGAELDDTSGWQRIDGRYCTLWLHPELATKSINRKISTRWVRLRMKIDEGTSPESELGAKCDILFRRAQEVLDMYPPGIHVSVKVAQDKGDISRVHRHNYGHDTEAVAFYLFQNNTIYASARDLSESVLIHEMAHCIVDHYFQVRPPRKIEEMLAMYADQHLRD